MSPSHALTVESRDCRPSPFPPSARTSGNSPETPTPVDEQSANLSFADALALFRSANIRAGMREPRRTRYEQALVVDMRAESAPRARLPCQLPPGRGGMPFMKAISFMEWARDHQHELSVPLIRMRWCCSRATAYRRLALASAVLRGT